MADQWYYQLLSKEYGPVQAATVVELHRVGTLDDEALVRSDEEQDWQPIRSSALIQSQDSSADASDLTDLSELSFQFEESSSPAAAQDAAATDATATGTAEGDVAEIGDLSELSFEFEDNVPSAPRKMVDGAAAEHTEQSDTFWYQSLGQTLGPLSLAELVRIAEEGGIGDDDLVRAGDQGDWRSASEFDELSAAILASRFADDGSDNEAEWFSPATSMRTGTDGSGAAEPAAAPPADADGDNAASPAEEADEAAEATPRKVRSRSDSGAGSRKASAKGRKRKRRRRKEDAMLTEIFDEIFSEDDEEPAATRGGAAAASAAAAPAEPAAPQAPQTPATAAPQPVPPTQPAGAYGTPPGGAMGGYGAPGGYSPPPQPAFRPPTPPRRSSGGGFSLDFSEITGGTVAIGGGGLLLVLLIAAFSMGWVSMPKLGTASIESIKTDVQFYFDDYKKFVAGSPDGKAWENYSTDLVTELSDMMADLQTQVTDSESDKAVQEALGTLLAIVSSGINDTDRRGRLEKKFEELIPKMGA